MSSSASPPKAHNLPAEVDSLSGYFQPKHLLTLNNSHSLKVAKLQGGFIFHAHPNTDELFYCVSGGPMVLELANETSNNEREGEITRVELNPGDVFCVPQGRRHRPVAQRETGVLIIEKVGTVNTGDEEGSEVAKGVTAYVDERGAA